MHPRPSLPENDKPWKRKAGELKAPSQVDVIQFTIRLMFLLPSSTTSNRSLFHSRKDIQTTFYPSAQNAHHKCNYECSSVVCRGKVDIQAHPTTQLSSSIPQFASAPSKKTVLHQRKLFLAAIKQRTDTALTFRPKAFQWTFCKPHSSFSTHFKVVISGGLFTSIAPLDP